MAENIEERAETYHRPLEEFLHDEAKNMVRNQPQNYIPDLKNPYPTRRSSKVTEYSQSKPKAYGIQ